MARSQIIIRPGTAPYKRQRHRSSGVRVAAEVAGGTAAECAAVWCCGPCTVVNLIVLAVYKVPARLCRKAIRRSRRRRMLKRGIMPVGSASAKAGVVEEREEDVTVVVLGESQMETDQQLIELEKEMWDKFYNTGFWRSASQRER